MLKFWIDPVIIQKVSYALHHFVHGPPEMFVALFTSSSEAAVRWNQARRERNILMMWCSCLLYYWDVIIPKTISSSDLLLKGTRADKDFDDCRKIKSVLRRRLNTPSWLLDCLLSVPPAANGGRRISILYPKVTAAQKRALDHDSKQLPDCVETQLFELLLFILQVPIAVFRNYQRCDILVLKVISKFLIGCLIYFPNFCLITGIQGLY